VNGDENSTTTITSSFDLHGQVCGRSETPVS
jgi:hypothetical protein